MKLLLPAAAGIALLFLYRKKLLSGRLTLLLLAGAVFSAGLILAELRTGGKEEVFELGATRSENALEAAPLEAETEDGTTHEVQLTIPEIRYTPEEAAVRLEETAAGLDSRILGKNTDYSHVEWNLELPYEFEDPQITAQWSSDQPEAVDWDGTLGSAISAEGIDVTLTGWLFLQDESLQITRKLKVYPSREEAAFAVQAQQAADELNTDPHSNYRLPEEVGGRQVKWFRPAVSYGSYLALLLPVLALFFIQNRKEAERKAAERRRSALLADYPELVCRLQLLCSAGLSIRRAMGRIASDYRKEQEEPGGVQNINGRTALTEDQPGRSRKKIHFLYGGDRRPRRTAVLYHPAYEETTRCVYDMESGMLESDALTHFGERCRTPEYRRLALLLTQSGRKSGSRLSEMLSREMQEALEGRKRRAREEGEKNTIRMMLPMGMMLIVVMAVIMVPALLSL